MATPPFMSSISERIKEAWGRMSKGQRISVCAGTVLVLAAFIGLAIYSSRPDFQVLYSNLTPEDANRVIKNTGFLYAKMGITMFISLYTTRLILNSLGASDFGIFNIHANHMFAARMCTVIRVNTCTNTD